MKTFEIRNNNSLINLSNSFLKHFGITPFHPTIPIVDEVLKNHKKVVVMLFDGMGKNIIHHHLDEKSFIRSHYLTTINSTFPPTTAAATISFLTGKYPIETGWIGWDVYVEQFNRNVILFKNRDYNTYEDLGQAGRDFIDSNLSYETILELIKKYNPSIDTYDIKRKPINPDGPSTLKESLKMLDSKLADSKECFIYFYFDSPDYEMHANGIDKRIVRRKVKSINRFVKKVVKHNPDTVFFTIADHGHINVKYLDLCEHPDLLDLVKYPVSCEKRTPMFFIKEGMTVQFESLFNKYYGEYFVLMNREEILSSHLYGEGNPHPLFNSFIGDYIAIGVSEYSLLATNQFKDIEMFPGHHAGGTDDERYVDVSVFLPE